MRTPDPASKRHVLFALILASGFAVLFAALRSTDILAVDGSYRCLEVWHRQSLFFQGNRHLLYPLDVLLWTRMAGALGMGMGTPLRFLTTVDLMNALSGAVCLAIFYLLVYRATRSFETSITSAVAFGLSNAFLAAAVNANEPMMGLLWSLLAIWLAVQGSLGRWRGWLFLSGVLFSLSLATYESMALLAPAALLVVYMSQKKNRLWRLGIFGAGGFVGVAAIYGPVYWLLGARSFRTMLTRFVALHSRGYLGVSIARFLTVPLGLTSGFTGLLRYLHFNGLRLVVHGGPARFLTLGIFPLVFAGALTLWLLVPIRRWRILEPAERLGFSAAILGLAFTLAPVALWGATYDKLWIQPVGCILFACSISARAALRPGRPATLARVAAAAFILAAATSLPWAWRLHERGTPELPAVGRFASTLASGDLVVGGWDSASTLYGSIWADQRPNPQQPYASAWASNPQFFSFTTEAQRYGLGSLPRLREAVLRTQADGGRVYFLGLLGSGNAGGEEELLSKFGIPLSALGAYRAQSVAIATVPVRGGDVAVRVLDGPRNHP